MREFLIKFFGLKPKGGRMKCTFLTLRIIEEWMSSLVVSDDFVAKHGAVLGVKVGPFYREKDDCVWGTHRMKDMTLRVVEVRQPVDNDGCPKTDLDVSVRPPTEDEET